jgi:hypothetical protein
MNIAKTILSCNRLSDPSYETILEKTWHNPGCSWTTGPSLTAISQMGSYEGILKVSLTTKPTYSDVDALLLLLKWFQKVTT